MYPVSIDFQDAIKSNTRTFALRLEIETAFETFNLTDADVEMGSLKLDEKCAAGDTFSLGAAIISLFDIALNNRDGRYSDVQFNGGRMRPKIGLLLPNGTYEWVPLGVFNIDEVSRPTTSVPLGGSDNLVLLDHPFSEVPITFPCSHAQLLATICNTCGVTLQTSSFLNSSHIVQSAPDGSKSCRDIVSDIAELAAGYVQCDRDTGALKIVQYVNPGCVQEANIDGGNFIDPLSGDTADGGDFFWYNTKPIDGGAFITPTPAASLGPGNRKNFKVDDNPITVMGIVYEAKDQDYVIGDRTYALHIKDNDLIQGDPTALLQSLADVMIGLTYLPYTSEWQGNPAMQPGDIVRQTDRNGTSYLTIVTNCTYAYRKSCTLSAKGASQLAAGYQSQQSKKETQLLRLIHQKQIQIDSLDQAILTATNLIAGTLGGYAITGTGQYEGNQFVADNPDITKATKVWRWNLGGFGYSEHGVNGPYETAITKDGSIIANVVTASMIKTGRLESLTNPRVYFDLDIGELCASRLVASDTSGINAHIGQEDPQYGSAYGFIINDTNGIYFQAMHVDNYAGTTLTNLKGAHLLSRGDLTLQASSIGLNDAPNRLDFYKDTDGTGIMSLVRAKSSNNGGSPELVFFASKDKTGLWHNGNSVEVENDKVSVGIGGIRKFYVDSNGMHGTLNGINGATGSIPIPAGGGYAAFTVNVQDGRITGWG